MNRPEWFSATALAEFIQGPMAWAAFIICGLGLVIQILRLMAMTQKREIPRPLFEGPAPDRPFSERFKGGMIFLRVSILGVNPCVAAISFIFHGALIGTPLVVMAHNVLLDTAFGWSFFSLSERATDSLTLVVIFCGGFFLVRRLALRRVRMISGPSDFMLLAAAVGPFLTGFLAYHHIGAYPAMVTLHILSGEIFLVMIPFSRFSHMIFFVVSRFLIIGEHGRKSARRVWRYQGNGSGGVSRTG